MKAFKTLFCHPLVIGYLLLAISSCPAAGQLEVHDAVNQAVSQANHAEDLTKWAESINKATQQINQLNSLINQMDDVQGLLGKGMEAVGIDPSISSTIQLAKSLNNFGQALQGLQHSAGSVSFDLDKLRHATTDPSAWQRYVVTSRSYESTQKAQKDYDDQIRKLDARRSQAEAQLKAARSLGETAKAQAALDSVDAAEKALAEERKRAFEQQQANWIENQNQKDAWEQAARDWTKEEWKTVGSGLSDYMKGASGNP